MATMADGMTQREVLQAFPGLQPGDVRETLVFAGEAVRDYGQPRAGG